VITFSSGNHAQGTALAAQLLGIPAVIVMPQDAPAAKVAATRGYGAEVVTYDRYTEDREAIGARLAAERKMTLIPPYDHPHVMAGQGTATLELLQETGPLDALFVCLGGGGLLSGAALAARALAPDCKIYGVEPEAGNDGQQSLRAGQIVHIDTPKTIADGAQTQHLGKYTFEVIRQLVDDIHTVSDAELIAGLRFFAERMKMVVEPTGCLGFAAARKLKDQLQGKRVGVIISGGNVDLGKLSLTWPIVTPISSSGFWLTVAAFPHPHHLTRIGTTMPHLVLEYTGNLALDVQPTLLKLNQALVASGHFDENAIKARAVRLDDYLVGTAADAKRAFVALRLSILTGRTLEEKKQVADLLGAAIQKDQSWPAQTQVQITVDVVDMQRETYFKLALQ
jgi:threonine dehydratase